MPSRPIMVVCADKTAHTFLQREGIQCRLADAVLPDFGREISPFGTANFSKLNRLKLNLLEMFAKEEQVKTNIYVDGDIIVNGDIVSDLVNRLDISGAPLLWMPCDQREDPCTNPNACPNLCTGLVAFRKGIPSDLFRITDAERWKQRPEDQVWVNAQIAITGFKAGTLPRPEYQNGVRLPIVLRNSDLKLKTLCWHYNFRVGDSKKADMKRYGDWLLPY